MDLLHAPRPGGVVRVGLALVQQHALDHAVLLGDARHVQQALVGAHPIRFRDIHEPAARRIGGFRRQVFLAGVLVPEFQLGTRYGHVNYAHADLIRQVLNHLASEEIDRAHVAAFAADGRDRRVPLAHFAAVTGHVHRRHELEAGVVEALVLGCGPRAGFHVGLAEAEIDVEIRVGRLCQGRQAHRQGRQGGKDTLDHLFQWTLIPP